MTGQFAVGVDLGHECLSLRCNDRHGVGTGRES